MQSGIVPLDPVDRILERYGFNVSVGVRRYTEPYWHIHRGIEIIFVHSGTADIYANNQHHVLNSGELIMTSMHSSHSSGGDFSRTVIHFVPDLLPIEAHDRMSRLLGGSEYMRTAIAAGSAARFNWAVQELRCLNGKYDNYPLVQALMGLVVVEIESVAHQPRAAEQPLLQQIINYMRVNIVSDEKLECLADRFQISSRHLYNLFMSELGCSPRQYWISLKLAYAQSLLQSDQRIHEIAAAAGFQTVRGFQRAFERAFHVTPSEFRDKTKPPVDR